MSARLTDAILEVSADGEVVWDFDGVVADTEPLHDLSYRSMSEARGWTPALGYFRPLVGRTEDEIWQSLVEDGFPAPKGLDRVMGGLKEERKRVFADLAASRLTPSWIARQVMPAVQEAGRAQFIVSNGDPDVIETLLHQWQMFDLVHVARRAEGVDKTDLVRSHCSPGVVLLEDNAGWLAMGHELGATTVGVLHDYNATQDLRADILVRL